MLINDNKIIIIINNKAEEVEELIDLNQQIGVILVGIIPVEEDLMIMVIITMIDGKKIKIIIIKDKGPIGAIQVDKEIIIILINLITINIKKIIKILIKTITITITNNNTKILAKFMKLKL
jgi:hypothetical protein